MTTQHTPAYEPEGLTPLFLERANKGDVEGVLALYEDDAVHAVPGGEPIVGKAALRAAFTELFATGRRFSGEQRPVLRGTDLALTSTPDGSGELTVEVARRQPDGTWLWVLDQPNILG